LTTLYLKTKVWRDLRRFDHFTARAGRVFAEWLGSGSERVSARLTPTSANHDKGKAAETTRPPGRLYLKTKV